MDQLTHLVTFARVVQAGGFAAAARRLGLTASVASKHVAKLEQKLGARLLQRSTRKLSLTEAGAAYYEHCARILEEIEHSQQAIARMQAEPAGVLRVSAMMSFVNSVLTPLLPEFLARHPKMELEFVTGERMVDLADEGFDLALRITVQPPANLVARPLAPIRFLVCASPGYLRGREPPRSVEQLIEHDCLSYPAPLVAHNSWPLCRGRERCDAPVRSRLRISSVDSLHRLVLAGQGIGLLPSYAIGEDLRSGRLVHLLPEHFGYDAARLWAVHLPNRYGSPKLRAFVDFLIEKIGERPYWDPALELLSGNT